MERPIRKEHFMKIALMKKVKAMTMRSTSMKKKINLTKINQLTKIDGNKVSSISQKKVKSLVSNLILTTVLKPRKNKNRNTKKESNFTTK